MENRNPVIAIVDDDASVRNALRELLRAMGYAAEGFGSAEDYLASESRSRFGCLIVDVHLPGVSGPGLISRLAGNGETLPAVLITAHDDPATLDLIRAAGPLPHLRKPFSEAELIEAIERALTPEYLHSLL